MSTYEWLHNHDDSDQAIVHSRSSHKANKLREIGKKERMEMTKELWMIVSWVERGRREKKEGKGSHGRYMFHLEIANMEWVKVSKS